MSLPLSVMSVIATSSWVLYGALVKDAFVIVSIVKTSVLLIVYLFNLESVISSALKRAIEMKQCTNAMIVSIPM